MKVIGIHLEIPKKHVYKKLEASLIKLYGEEVPKLTKHNIKSSTWIMAQIGLEPYLKAMKDNPGLDIIISSRAYNPAPFAVFCLYKGFTNIGRCLKLPSTQVAIPSLLIIYIRAI